MSTSATSAVARGEITTLTDFALKFCRAVTPVCILLRERDLPADTPLPEIFPPGDDYTNMLEKAERKLAEVRAWTDEEAETAASEAFVRLVNEVTIANEVQVKAKEQLEKMLAEVRAWQPPTPDHEAFRDKMIGELHQELKAQTVFTLDLPHQLTGSQFKTEQITMLEKDVADYRQKREQYVAYINESNLWLKQLRDSLVSGVTA